MKKLLSYITQSQELFLKHEFFSCLQEIEAEVVFKTFEKHLSFWVVSFQDLLGLVSSRIEDPDLKKIALHHLYEDRGHHIWFIDDLKKQGLLRTDEFASGVFNQCSLVSRNYAYQIISEIYRNKEEALLVALLLTVENPGHVFFEEMSHYTRRKGLDKKLKYFTSFHLDVEKSHAVFESEMQENLQARELETVTYQEGVAMVDRVNKVFVDYFNFLSLQMKNQTLSQKAKGNAPSQTLQT
jgi:hypothetical protein